MSTRLIIDTNVVVKLEDNLPVMEIAAQLLALLQTNNVQVLVHPASIKDTMNDKDEDRRNIQLSKLKKYGELRSPPSLDRSLFSNAGVHIGNAHDEIDCTILTALAKDAVHYLITEDRGIHAKARRLLLQDRVLTIEQALTYFSAAFAKKTVELPNLEFIMLHQIRDELQDKLFDSLREDYVGFDSWFVKSCKEERQAWIARDPSGKLGAVCIIKEEENPQVTDTWTLFGKVLKLCTFKVETNVRGQKLGEHLLKASFRYASGNRHEKIYVTAKTKQNELTNMLTDFGFQAVGTDSKGDLVFVKEHPVLPPSVVLDPIEYHVKYAPHFLASEKIGKFIVPIRPEYHKLLFPDAGDSVQLNLQLNVKPSPGNAIKLAYLCHANTNAIKAGDVLLFYRSEDSKECTTIGIVESPERLDDADMILEKVLKRTVYTRSEIERISEDDCLVILFRLQGHFVQPVGFDRLSDLGIKGAIQTIRKISDEQFRAIAKLGLFENSISAD